MGYDFIKENIRIIIEIQIHAVTKIEYKNQNELLFLI